MFDRFLEKWIFSGSWEDCFSEFGLLKNERFLCSRNRNFWSGAFAMVDATRGSVDSDGGAFIRDMQQQVFLCGKSLNLLKICNPRHFLCLEGINDHPKLSLSVSALEVSFF